MHFIYYINRVIATKGDSTYLGYLTSYGMMNTNWENLKLG